RRPIEPKHSLELAVVEAAQQAAVGDAGGSAVAVFDDVMSLGPLRGRVTAGEAAPAVPGGHGQALSGGEQALSGADAGDGPDLVQHDGDDLRSAVQPQQRFSRGQDDAVAGGGGALP